MRKLVTGGAGLIGSHIVDLLLSQGQSVVILDNLDPQTHPLGRPPWIPGDVEFIDGDLRDATALREALRGVDEIYHQAAFGGFTTEVSKYIDANGTGTAKLFEVLIQDHIPVRKVVVASSQAVYGEGAYRCSVHGMQFPPSREMEQLQAGDWELHCQRCENYLEPTPTPTAAPFNGHTPYALSKMVEERIALSMGKRCGVPVTALRYAITYGPRQSLFNPYTGVVSIFSTRLLNGLPPVLYEDGQQSRDFIFVGDVARANLHVMNDPRADYKIFNVGTGRATRMYELAETLASTYASELSPQLLNDFRPGDARHIVHDVSDLSRIGYTAETSLSQGIGRFADWIRQQGDVAERFSEAEAGLREVGVVQSCPSP